MSLFRKLTLLSHEKKTSLCIGLDDPDPYGRKERIFRLIENTEKHTLCYKLNPAFYGDSTGEAQLRDIAFFLNSKNIPWIYDGKRGDVPHTNVKYAQIIYDVLQASAVTLNPLLGLKALTPFRREGKGIFLLDQTSNEGAEEIQQLTSKVVRKWSRDNSDIGVVVAANKTEALKEARAEIGDKWILSPGVGIQGGVIAPSSNTLFSVSRSILFSKNQAAEAERLAKMTQLDIKDLLMRKGLVLKGDFTLSNGSKSDTYIDLRQLSANPSLYKTVAERAAQIIPRGDVLAVATGGIAIAASICLSNQTPFGYIRQGAKTHGAKNLIEGDISKVFPVVIVDDTATSGASLIKAIKEARSQGYIVSSALVIVERVEGRAREALKDIEVSLTSLVQI